MSSSSGAVDWLWVQRGFCVGSPACEALIKLARRDGTDAALLTGPDHEYAASPSCERGHLPFRQVAGVFHHRNRSGGERGGTDDVGPAKGSGTVRAGSACGGEP